jgi:hypothetical protein
MRMNTTKKAIGMLPVGTLVARVEAPTVLYRVTSTLRRDVVRILPFRRSGAERVLVNIGGVWAADGSQWTAVHS